MSLYVNSLISLRLGAEDCLAVIYELQSDEVLGQKKGNTLGRCLLLRCCS